MYYSVRGEFRTTATAVLAGSVSQSPSRLLHTSAIGRRGQQEPSKQAITPRTTWDSTAATKQQAPPSYVWLYNGCCLIRHRGGSIPSWGTPTYRAWMPSRASPWEVQVVLLGAHFYQARLPRASLSRQTMPPKRTCRCWPSAALPVGHSSRYPQHRWGLASQRTERVQVLCSCTSKG